ncbi:GntR family transcriptional regulator [Bacillus sp. IB182487]|uniref:GntR family transcriptional regulator n=1 Tax=Metabacillus arenae TaxID=2771434 RepID=A0A926NJ60_9BACI|nr:GntR family transcriptional regulator [Metabacillus arenae]
MTEALKVGEKLPSEAELDKIYNVSRTPVKQALNQLENDGYIYRLQGKGSFVANRRPAEIWTRMTGFRSNYLDKWEKISSKTIEISQRKGCFTHLFNIDDNEKITYLKRVRYFDDKPILYLEHYVNPFIPNDIFENNHSFISLGQLLKEKLNIEMVRAEEEIEPINATTTIANILHIPEGTPLLKVTRISYDQKNLPIDVNPYIVNTKEWKYKINFRQEDVHEDF